MANLNPTVIARLGILLATVIVVGCSDGANGGAVKVDKSAVKAIQKKKDEKG